MTGRSTPRGEASIAFVAAICVALAIAICTMGLEFLGLGPRDTAHRQSPFPGFTVEAASEGGLVVTSVKGDSAAEHAGLMAGDRITQLDRRSVSSLGQAVSFVRRNRDGHLKIGLVNHHRHRTITVTTL